MNKKPRLQAPVIARAVTAWSRRLDDERGEALHPPVDGDVINLDAAFGERFFEALLAGRERPREITTDLAAPLLRVVDELVPDALHDTTQYANNRIECDHGRLKARLRPMRGLRTDRTATVVIRGHAFIQNLRRGHYELGVEARHDRLRIAAAFDDLATVI